MNSILKGKPDIQQLRREEEEWLKLRKLSDIFVGLMEHRILFLGAHSVDEHGRPTVTDIDANILIGRLLFMEAEDADKDINLYINTPGGAIAGMLALYDTMQFIKPDVSTICVGQAASAGALLLAAGAKGKRYALPNSRVMIHQPRGGAAGTALDVDIEARELMKMRKVISEILAKHTGKSRDKIEKDTARNLWMSAVEAKEYGIVDEVISIRK